MNSDFRSINIKVYNPISNLMAISFQDSSRKTVIGLLDIYGFEVFHVNRYFVYVLWFIIIIM